jgi:adenosine deaminase CECR1
MSHEFYQIMVGAPTMSLYSWKQLARWSIDYSCLSKAQKTRGHEILAQEWRTFCDYVVDTYGDLMVNGEIDEAKFKEKCAKGRCEKPKELS